MVLIKLFNQIYNILVNLFSLTHLSIIKSYLFLQNSINFPGGGFYVSASDIDENGTQNAVVRYRKIRNAKLYYIDVLNNLVAYKCYIFTLF